MDQNSSSGGRDESSPSRSPSRRFSWQTHPSSRHPPALRDPSPRDIDSGSERGAISPLESEVSFRETLPPMSPSVQDRVFPIRSVVSVEPTPTPTQKHESSDGFPGIGSTMEQTPSLPSPYAHPTRRFSNASFGSSKLPDYTPSEASSRQPRDRTRSRASRDDPPRGRAASGVTTIAASAETHGPWHAGVQGETTSTKSSSARTSPSAISRNQKPASMKSAGEELGGGVLTARFKHVTTEGGHAVITGRDGDTLQRCEDEPIRVPGAVQGFGLLIALRELGDCRLEVRVVSENAKRIIGYTPKELFALENFTDILSEEQTDNLLDHLEFIKESDGNAETDGPEVFTISIRHPRTRRSQKLWCAMHASPSSGDLIICEFELEDDVENPLVPSEDAEFEPEDTLSSNPTAEEYAESTINPSRPLRVLRSARKKKSEAAAMEIFNIMSQIEKQLAAAPRLDAFLKILIGVVKELTGFHRVMIYQFDHEFNGRVVTELVDPRATKDLYKGLNFPASDIPKQARDLYRINKIRLLYDRDQETARLVCRTLEDLETPVDLTHAFLRAMSPIHIKYLCNMAVRSSMSISINAFDELWGLIACHTYGTKGMRVSFPIRKMCRLIGDIASRNIERLSYASRLQARKLINTVPTEKNPSGYIVASSDDLLKLFDADCGVLAIRDETKILGRLENSQEALVLIEYFRQRQVLSVMSTQDIRVDFPDLRYAPGFTSNAGLLLVPLSGAGSDFIVFFRKPQVREVKWAGNPYEKFVREGTEGYLEPRKSFKTWSETVITKCREWNEEQIETAAVLCLVYGKFIEVWRQKEAAIQNTQLTKLLLANSAHEVRTPLNAIINYLEIAMEGHLDQEVRDNLSRSHSASKSLIYVINDLLDLTKIEEGKKVIKDETFDLHDTVREATDPFVNDAKKRNIHYIVSENPGVPRLVVGDQRRVRQAIGNIVANAFQFTSQGSVKVELYLASYENDRVEVDIVVEDTGSGMSSKKLDALFRELEQVQSEGNENLADAITSDQRQSSEKKDKTLGYGLALVGRIVRNMNGQLRLKSEEGVGSRFVMQFAFGLPDAAQSPQAIETARSPTPGSPGKAVAPPPTEGEVLLVDKHAEPPPAHDLSRSRKASQDSLGSAKSGKSAKSLSSFKSGSSTRSDVDRLIDAIQEPHIMERPGSTRSSREVSSPSTAMKPPRPQLGRSNTAGGIIQTTQQDVQAPGAQMERQGSVPGQSSVTDQKTPIRPVRMPDEVDEPLSGPRSARPMSVTFNLPPETQGHVQALTAEHMEILVAEDDPVNCKIMSKRLQKLGHDVIITVNGEECASSYGERSTQYDVVLMDMQMPIVDGLTSTKMIRSFEKSNAHQQLSPRAQLNNRVPIFAVSATLIESDRQTYIDAGFDGWILKPVDFKRLTLMFEGIVDPGTRARCAYEPGAWEKGGWFKPASHSPHESSTTPDPAAAVSNISPVKSFPPHGENPFDDRISHEQQRLESLQTDAVNDPSRPTNE